MFSLRLLPRSSGAPQLASTIGRALAARPLLRANASLLSTAASSIRVPTKPLNSGVAKWGKRALMAILGAVAFDQFFGSRAEACGIIGVVGKSSDPAVNFLLEGLHILQNRGYDSAGISTLHSDPKGKSKSIVTTKHASVGSTSDSIQLLDKNAPARHNGDTVGIAHTRWATHGGKTDENAHPHLDYKERVALVHNGTIENSSELRAELEAQGIKFRSQTDTEVIVQLIGKYLDDKLPILDAVKKALGRLEGTWGIAVIAKDSPDQIIAARNGSPLVVGIGKDRMFIASEFTAFCRHTNEYISLQDGEVMVIKADGAAALDVSRVEIAPEQKIDLSPAPYPHWTIKEIMEQPAAISRALNLGGRIDKDGNIKLGGLDQNVEKMMSINNLVMAACGTSYYASLYGAQLMRSLQAFETVQPVDASELTSDFMPRQKSGVLLVSQSGETKDVHRALQLAQSLSVPTLSVVNAVGSLIARSTKCGVYTNAGREHAVASTKAFVTQVTVMALIAAWFSQKRSPIDKSGRHSQLVEALHDLPTYTRLALKTRDQVKGIATKLAKEKTEHMFILGKGYAEPIAREGALKIKEITYVHAEGFPGGALKHGPFALIEEGTPVILMILDDQNAGLMNTAAQEVRARGAYTIVITDNDKVVDKKAANELVKIPSNGPLTALLATVPLQLLAYELAVAKGISPDMPRNLAKSVTVD